MNQRVKSGNGGPANGARRVLRSSVFPLRSLLRKEEGANLVEFALSAAVFFTVLFGIMGFSILAYSYIFVSHAAREATRYAIVRGYSLGLPDCSGVGQADCIAQGGNTGDISEYVKSLAPLGINGSKLIVNSNWLTAVGGSCGIADTCKTINNKVWVQVSYTYPLNIPFIPQQDFTISSSSQMAITN